MGHSVTVLKGPHMTTASASSTSNVSAETEVTLTITPASGYKAVLNVVTENVTITGNKFTMPDEDVVITVQAVSTSLYRVLEEAKVNVNNNPITLHRNVILRMGANGDIAEATTDPTTITDAPSIAALLAAGLIEAI